ncbi:MAG: DUF4342 domain-containing protein, partial [Clostridiales bacterium]|nr:DUF4342 domain-containing protein [Clostridiales bacterium]
MEITLEKIELVKDRTGVGYREAKEALEKTGGNVVDAIILIEDSIDEAGKDSSTAAGPILDSIKEAIRKGNVNKIVVKKNDEIVLNLPVNIGIIGTVFFPWAAIAASIVALGTSCNVELVKEDGSVVDVSKKAAEIYEDVKDKGSEIYEDVKDKGEDFFEAAKDKGEEIFEAAKDKGGEIFEAAKDKGGEIFEAAKGKGGELFEAAKDKGEELIDA